MTEIAEPIDAATVVVARDSTEGLEVLMLRRNSKIYFGGMWVFPGGKVDPADRADSTAVAVCDEGDGRVGVLGERGLAGEDQCHHNDEGEDQQAHRIGVLEDIEGLLGKDSHGCCFSLFCL